MIQRLKPAGDSDDSKAVAFAATALHVSEHDIFRLAYRNWFGYWLSDDELDAEFGRYLNYCTVPIWVRDFTRKVLQLQADGQLAGLRRGLDLGRGLNVDEVDGMGDLSRLLIGSIASIIACVAVLCLVFLAIRSQELNQLSCMLPPCY